MEWTVSGEYSVIDWAASPPHTEVIEYDRGNEYKEGTTGCDNREWKGKRIKGELSRHQNLEDDPLF